MKIRRRVELFFFSIFLGISGIATISKGARSQEIIPKGIVVSDDRAASEWGTEILKQGGNAIDAAVATAFMLAVTRPHYASIGGGGFLLYCPKESTAQSCQIIDFREVAPANARPKMFVKRGKAIPALSRDGPMASGVPGVVAGLLLALEKFGTKRQQELLSRPIIQAKAGYAFTPYAENAAHERWTAMNEAAHSIFGCPTASKELEPCPVGKLIPQPDLARVLESVSKQGKDGFYQGWVAKAITQGIRNSGGILSLDDLKFYQPKMRTPLVGKFKNFEVVTMPPPSSGGIILLQLLHYSELAEKSGELKNGFGSLGMMHAITHGMSLAFADRALYLGDPSFVQIPVQQLLSKTYLDQRWKTFNKKHSSWPESAGKINTPVAEPQHTTHLSVMDRNGNAVAVTTTVNNDFGSGFVPPGTGVVMNDQMDDFSIQPGIPNQFGLVGNTANEIQPLKRPLSSMTPTIVKDKSGANRMVIGAAGGPKIPTSVFLSLLNRITFKMPIVEAVAAPRFHHQWLPNTLRIENWDFGSKVRSQLEKLGYSIINKSDMGKIHALERLPNGKVQGAADPRGEGASAVE